MKKNYFSCKNGQFTIGGYEYRIDKGNGKKGICFA